MVSIEQEITRTAFPAMGNTARITIVGGDSSLIDHASHRLRELEERWSRFIASSDISRLNSAAGSPVRVAADTIQLIRYMVGGWTLTHGLFDPSMLGELVAAGYGRSLTSNAMTVLPTGVEWVKDVRSVSIDDDVVTLPVGLVLDPGGIGKGLAADIVATDLVDLGASGAFVSVGGDIRCIGTGDIDGRWVIDIESPFDRTPMCSIEFTQGAVATSSLSAKMFASPENENSGHLNSHIMDPSTRRTVDMNARDVLQASVIAAECVWAEVFAKAYLVLDAPNRIEFATEHGLDALVVRRDGALVSSSGWKEYQR